MAADFRLRQLAALDDIDALTAIVARVRPQVGGRIDWNTLVRGRVLAAVPTDPTGVPYELAADGTVTIGPSSTLGPLPTLERTP